MTDNDTKNMALCSCPYCGEQILVVAKKCKHCGEIVDTMMREIEMLKNQKQSVFMNAGGGGAAASSSSGGNIGLRGFSHGWHIILSIFTGGVWIPFYILFYIFRDKRIYY